MDAKKIFAKYRIFFLVTAALVSLLVSVTCLEGVLYLAGKFVTYARREPASPLPTGTRRLNKDTINILALGDSYTFGGAGSSRNAYPSFLGRMLDAQLPSLVHVTNQGVCEATSKDVLNGLGNLVAFARPDVVLLLVGGGDQFDPYPFADELKSTQEKYESFVRRLRVFKLARHIYFELRAKAEARGRSRAENVTTMDFANDERLARGVQLFRDRKYGDSFAIFEAAKDSLPTSEARRAFVRKLTSTLLDPLPPFISGADFEQQRLLLVKLGPAEEQRRVIEELVAQYQRDPELSPRNAIAAIDYIVRREPAFRENRRLMAARIALGDLEAWRANVGRWYAANLQRIVARLQQDRIEVVLQTYPLPSEPINSITREFARANGLPLVDHERIFAPLIAGDRKKYIKDDHHCTDLGHRVMAENVFTVLKEKFFGNEESIARLKRHNSYTLQ